MRNVGRPPIRLMIVDDSLVARTALRRMVEGDGDLKVVATVSSAPAAIEALATTRVDVILLDLEMPGIGGLEALPAIIQAGRGARVLVVSSLTEDGAEQSLRALALGAADTHPKPSSNSLSGTYCDALIAKVRMLGRHHSERAEDAGLLVASPPTSKLPRILAVGASTGGIHALSTLLRALPKHPGIPILVTQHLPPAFMELFSRQLRLASGFDAVVAEEGMRLEPDRIFIAPGDAHLTVTLDDDDGMLRALLDRTPAASGCMPSVDTMFASLAQTLGGHALGVVLSGMGRDGADGAARIVDAGGLIYAQDEASSAVWGMPRAVADAGLAMAIGSPAEIALRVVAGLGLRRSAGNEGGDHTCR